MSLLETFTSVIFRSLPEPHAGLLSGILFGTKATLSADFKTALIATGTIHIVALSGMNITILITFAQYAFLRFMKRSFANFVSIAFIIGFIFIVGVSASVIRASVMGCISLLAVNLGRKNIPLYTLCIAVFFMVLLHPPWVTDLSFQLSVLATLGIILFGKKRLTADSGSILHPVSKLYSLIEDDLRITLAAQVFTIPLILFQFHRLSLIAPLSNILIGWLITPIMIFGFMMIAVGLVWLPLGQIVGMVLWVLLSFVIFMIQATSAIPFASVGF